jgi:signal transduction histidine kinase
MERSGRLAQAATLLAVTGVYFATGKLGLLLAYAHPSASPVWPASGVALAAVLLLGQRVWPGVFAGALLVSLDASTGAGASLAIAAGNTLEAVAAGYLMTRFARGADALEKPREVFRFVMIAGLIAPAIGATVAITSLVLTGLAGWPQYAQLWLTWSLGDACGTLIVAPALILLVKGDPFECGRARLIEAIAFLATLFAVGTIAFSLSAEPVKFLCLPPVIWAAFRLGQRGTAVTVLTLAAFAAWGAHRGYWSVPAGEANRALLLLQVFMAVISVTGLTLAAVVTDWRRGLQTLGWQAQELERSNAELASFAHVVSHDLKAPLRGIESLAAWIAEDNKDLLGDEAVDQLRLLEGRAKRMSRLIDGVLAYSRVARTRRMPERVDAGGVVAEVVDSLGPTQAKIRIEGPLPGVRYDRTQLAQVFQNLIVNAVQHMGRVGGEIVVSCQDRHEVFEFAVADDGVGIEAVHAERIFRMFQALRPERETAGVGLSIVKKIVEGHGGAIHVEPTPGGGATFRFSVPKQPRDRTPLLG